MCCAPVAFCTAITQVKLASFFTMPWQTRDEREILYELKFSEWRKNENTSYTDLASPIALKFCWGQKSYATRQSAEIV